MQCLNRPNPAVFLTNAPTEMNGAPFIIKGDSMSGRIGTNIGQRHQHSARTFADFYCIADMIIMSVCNTDDICIQSITDTNLACRVSFDPWINIDHGSVYRNEFP
ncbi:hypothetical protein SDC9_205206 [bioreactor metagenome]|uniref:Uncharacterized protein n=1 Tax=bioreactor metagenome TaxID=1076179 RepID=A0A645J325_9ZZZZ